MKYQRTEYTYEWIRDDSIKGYVSYYYYYLLKIKRLFSLGAIKSVFFHYFHDCFKQKHICNSNYAHILRFSHGC